MYGKNKFLLNTINQVKIKHVIIIFLCRRSSQSFLEFHLGFEKMFKRNYVQKLFQTMQFLIFPKKNLVRVKETIKVSE